MDAQMKKRELLKVTNTLLKEAGWDNVTQFQINSKVPYTLETVRRAFTETRHNLSPEVLAIILKYLGCSKAQITEILTTYTDDKEFYKLIGETDDALTLDEQALIGAYRKIVASNPDALGILADNLAFIARSAGVDVTEETRKMRRGHKKG